MEASEKGCVPLDFFRFMEEFSRLANLIVRKIPLRAESHFRRDESFGCFLASLEKMFGNRSAI